MRYRNVGQTGVRISEIGFGCGNGAVLMVKAPHDEQLRVVRRALELGINFFDTAYFYGKGESEKNLGRILGELGADPVISTKIMLGAHHLGALKAATIEAIDEGLARLGLNRVEFVQLHTMLARSRAPGERFFCVTPDEVLGPDGVLEGLKTMRDRGKVGHFGFSGLGDPHALHELVDSGEFHGFQAYFNMLNPSAGFSVPPTFGAIDYGRIIDRAAARGMGSFVIRILATGALTSSPSAGGGGSPVALSPGSDYASDLLRAEKVRRALKLEGERVAQSAIRFGLMHSGVSSVLVGFSSVSQVEAAAACSGAPQLSDEQMAALANLWQKDFA